MQNKATFTKDKSLRAFIYLKYAHIFVLVTKTTKHPTTRLREQDWNNLFPLHKNWIIQAEIVLHYFIIRREAIAIETE